MKQAKNFVQKYQVLLFFLLAYLFSWWSVPLAGGRIIPHGPAIAALVILAVTAGRMGLRDFWHELTSQRSNWRWYGIAASIHLAYIGGATVLCLLFGAQAASAPGLSLATLGQLMLLGGQWEEIGWTGYALPRLMKHLPNVKAKPFPAILIAGVFRGIWHLPLFLYGHIPWFDILIFNFAFQTLIAWLFIKTKRSTLVVFWFHFLSNIMGVVMGPVFTGADRTLFYALFTALATVLALVIVAITGFAEGGKPSAHQLSQVSIQTEQPQERIVS